jgi:hypothetical protein
LSPPTRQILEQGVEDVVVRSVRELVGELGGVWVAAVFG